MFRYKMMLEYTDLQITVLVDQNVTRLQVSVDNSCRVNVFQSSLRNIHTPINIQTASEDENLTLTRI